MKKVLLTATVQSHICQFHRPLVHMLHEQGIEVHAAARNNLAEKSGLSIDFVDRVYDIPFSRSPLSSSNIRAYKQLKRIIDDGDYDIVHCNTPMGGVITRFAAISAGKKGTKVFYTAHGFHFYKGAPIVNWILYYPLEILLAHFTDKLITITKEDCSLASRKFSTNVYHIHGVGVDSKRFFPFSKETVSQLRTTLGYNDGQFLVLCVGEFLKNKNQSTVIRATALLHEQIPQIKLLLAGNGPMEQELKDIVHELNIDDHVEFLGYRTDTDRYLNACDMVVSASFREGLPLNIMEAMRCGKPIVASKNRGHNELIADGETGYLVDADDAKAFAERIHLLYSNDGTRHSFSLKAIKSVEPYADVLVRDELRSIYMNYGVQ